MSIAQHEMLCKLLFHLDWSGPGVKPDAFAAQATMWQGLSPMNLRAIQLFAVEAITTRGQAPDTSVADHMRACQKILMDDPAFDIDLRRHDLLALRNSSDVPDALKKFSGAEFTKIVARLYMILCDNDDSMAAIKSMGYGVKTVGQDMNASFVALLFGKLVARNLIVEEDFYWRIKYATNVADCDWEDRRARRGSEGRKK
jgi:hypothetical protein